MMTAGVIGVKFNLTFFSFKQKLSLDFILQLRNFKVLPVDLMTCILLFPLFKYIVSLFNFIIYIFTIWVKPAVSLRQRFFKSLLRIYCEPSTLKHFIYIQ